MLKILAMMFIGVLSSVLFCFLATKLSDYSNRFTDWFLKVKNMLKLLEWL